MNTLVIVLIAAVCLIAAYALYGRWLAKKWGIDPKAKTPAVLHNDGQDYVPTDGWTVFAHQFSSIAGAGPVTGAIQAAAFGWLPVLLWIILGGIFFGAVTDFGALYASVKNDGKSMGLLIEKYIGKAGRKLFLGFCWLFCLIVIAAFADMVADTFNAYVVTDGVQALSENATVNGAAGSISLFFIGIRCGTAQSEADRMERSCVRAGMYRAGVCMRYEFPGDPGQRDVGIYCIYLYLPRGSASHVVCDAAEGLHVHIYVYRHDRRRGPGASVRASDHEPSIYRIPE